MFLSDRLEEIISESGRFDLDTCNSIIRAIGDKLEEELHALDKVAKAKGSLKSDVVYATIKRQENTFNQFLKKHPEAPIELIDQVDKNLMRARSLVDDAVERSRNRGI